MAAALPGRVTDAVPSAEELLACSVCHRTVSDPRLLPCSHSVCLTCVDSLRDASDMCAGKCSVCHAALQLPSDSSELPLDAMKFQFAKAFQAFAGGDSLCSVSGCRGARSGESALSGRAVCEQHLQAELDQLAAELASLREPVAAALSPASRLSAVQAKSAEMRQSLEATLRDVESRLQSLRELLEDAETLATKAVRIDIERWSSCSDSAESISAKLEQFEAAFESLSDLQVADGRSRRAVQVVEETKRALRQLDHLDDSIATFSDVLKPKLDRRFDVVKAEFDKMYEETVVIVDRALFSPEALRLKEFKSVKFHGKPQFMACLLDTDLMLDSASRVVTVPTDGLPDLCRRIPKSLLFVLFKNKDLNVQGVQLFTFPDCAPVFGAVWKCDLLCEKLSDGRLTFSVTDFVGDSIHNRFIVAQEYKLCTVSSCGKVLSSAVVRASFWRVSADCQTVAVKTAFNPVSIQVYKLEDMSLLHRLSLDRHYQSGVLCIAPDYFLVDVGDKAVSKVLIEDGRIAAKFSVAPSDARSLFLPAHVICDGSNGFFITRHNDSAVIWLDEDLTERETLKLPANTYSTPYKIKVDLPNQSSLLLFFNDLKQTICFVQC